MLQRLESHRHRQLLLFAALILILGMRAVLQLLLYRHGFLALTADEFGRAVLAQRWTQNGIVAWYGNWLPFYLLIFGSGLKFFPDLLWTPRLIAAGSGMLALLAVYALGLGLSGKRSVAWLGALLLALSPAALWLSSTGLTEMPYALLVLIFLVFFTRYWRTSHPTHLLLAALSLALACGLRFEGWTLAGLFGLALAARLAVLAFQRKLRRTELFACAAALALAGLVPFLWSLGNYLHFGDPFYYLDDIQNYKLRWYGSGGSFRSYLRISLLLDPWLVWLGALALLVFLRPSLRQAPLYPARALYACLTLLPALIFILLHGRQNEPDGNYIRYLAPFLFPFYPILAEFLVSVAGRLARGKILTGLGLGLAVLAITFTQLTTSFHYFNDPAGDGLAVGAALKQLRAQNPELAERFAVIELGYWRYLAIHVGANDTRRILYDRRMDLQERKTPSLITTDWSVFEACLAQYDPAWIVVRNPASRKAVEDKLGVRAEIVVNNYAFYNLSQATRSNAAPGAACPLLPGWGY